MHTLSRVVFVLSTSFTIFTLVIADAKGQFASSTRSLATPGFPRLSPSTCPEGFYLEGGDCARVISRSDPIHHCVEKHATLHRDKCVVTERIPDDISCFPGYVLNKMMCERLVEAPPLLSCKEGWTLEDGKCKQNERQCPPDWRLSNGGMLCEKAISVPPQKKCPPGAVRDTVTGDCYLAISDEPITTCPDGFTLANSENKCVGTEIVRGSTQCPPGFSRQEDSCEMKVEVPNGWSCPPNTTLNVQKQICESKREEPARVYCRRGFKFNETESICYRESKVRPEIGCHNQDYKLNIVNQECIGLVEVPGNLMCPKMFELVDNICRRKGLDRPVSMCPRNHQLDETKNICSRTSFKTPGFACPKGMRVVGGGCELTIETPVEYECPPDTVLKGRKCESRRVIPPTLTCERGRLKDNLCVEIHDRPAKFSCPNKAFTLERSLCTLSVFIKGELKCPHGTLSDNKCEVIIPVDPISQEDSRCNTRRCRKNHQ